MYPPATIMSSFHSYAFGLGIESDVPIDGLPPVPAAAPDLRIHMGSLPETYDRGDPGAREIWRSEPDPAEPGDAVALHASGNGDFLSLRYADGTYFVLRRSGDEVWAVWPDSLSTAAAATYLLGPVIGFVLRLRGRTCFHASAVVVADRVVLLAGPAGIGKSSTAAALALRGRRVIADDIAVIDTLAGQWVVHPSIPSVRLWDDVVETLYGQREALPLLAPGWEKRQLDLRTLAAGFCADQAVPLGAIYLLSTATARGRAERVRGREALMALVANTYANVLLDAPMRSVEFVVLSALVRDVPVWRVGVPDQISDLPAFCARIEAAGPSSEFGPDRP